MLEFIILSMSEEEQMADFAYLEQTSDTGPVYINLDYVTRIYTGIDPREPTEVVFVDGSTMSMTRSEGGKLLSQLTLCCRPRPAATSDMPSGRTVRQTAGRKASKASTPRRAAKRAG